jgi:putative ABC transport system ATP-binding protein
MKVRLQNISKGFLQGGNPLPILTDLALDVRDGETVAVVGESGSGKSTLLALLAGFERPDSGEIFWNGSSTSAWQEQQWARFRKEHLGFVFQNYHLIPYLTALENVALPLRLLGRADDQAAAALLQHLGLAHRLNHLPSQLSGGEAQRVGIGRALIHSPQLVLADEPTGSLDARTGAAVLEVFFHQMKERRQTALVVTHSSEVAARCDRVTTLREGRLWPV